MVEIVDELLALSHRIGAAGDLAILGEGNTSARVSEATFLVKSSGAGLSTLSRGELTECRMSTLLEALGRPEMSDGEVDQILLDARVDPAARKPSVEAYFHAALLAVPGVAFVAHCHPESVNAILCSPQAERFAAQRQCPDEVVCCGAASLYVPYVDPGLRLARVLRNRLRGTAAPKVILLGNHGVITIGASANAAWAALAMTCKAARIYLGANSLGGSSPLPPADIARLDGRPDEAYRRAALGLI